MSNKCRENELPIKGKCKDKESITVQELADEYGRYFQKDKRENGEEFWKAKDAPQELNDLIMEAHGGMIADDHRYEYVYESLDIISNKEEDLDDVSEEIDGRVDVYNHDLIEWLGSNLERIGYVDEAREEFGGEHSESIMRDIMLGQYREREEVYGSVLQGLRDILDHD